MSERTLGSLNADDIGATIEFSDGGATYCARLRSVQHGSGTGKTMVSVEREGWSLIKHFAYETPCVVTTPAADSGDGKAGEGA